MIPPINAVRVNKELGLQQSGCSISIVFDKLITWMCGCVGEGMMYKVRYRDVFREYLVRIKKKTFLKNLWRA